MRNKNDRYSCLTPDLQKVLQGSIDGMLEGINEGYGKADATTLMKSLIDGGLKGAIRFSDDDVAKLRRLAIKEWDEVGEKNPRCKKMSEILKKYMKDMGRI